MARANPNTDLTFSQRYECKYLVSPMLASSIRQFIRPFMRPDPFAEICDGFRYPISSLYLDSDDLKLYQQTVGGEKNRFKLRVRTYSDDPAHPAYLEVKRKVNNIVRKKRARLDRPQAQRMLDTPGGTIPAGVPADEADAVAFFASYMGLVHAKPVIRIGYLREAYESTAGDPVRVTLDTDLEHAITLRPQFGHGSGRWVTTPLDGVILEVKFTDNFPTWIPEMVRAFGLKQQPVPKYVLSLDHVMMQGRESSLALGGFSMPPRRA